MIDPKGTCHLVGCIGKGVHLVTEPHALPSDPPSEYKTRMEQQAREARPKIGAPDTWAPYEGGPIIPKPQHEHCIGYPVVQLTEVGAVVFCSIRAGKWNLVLLRGEQHSLGALVDRHKADCPNRDVR